MTETLLPVSVSSPASPASGQNPESLFLDGNSFEHGQRIAKMLASSDLVPAQFRGNIQNCLIAMELSSRLGCSPLATMQNLHIIHGRPSWSAQFIIACLNACGRFSPLRFEVSGEGDNQECKAVAIDLSTGEQVEGPAVSIKMAKAEGWYSKAGSKWQTMPELMLRYRSATFFGRLYAPQILLGMSTTDELQDIQQAGRQAAAQEINDLLREGDA
jgi:hypothetical protein